MKIDQKVTDDVKKTISLLDNIKNIEPDPFLYTRIKQEIDSSTNKKIAPSLESAFNFLKPIVFSVLIVFNVYSVIAYLSNGKVNDQYHRLYIKNVASEYSIKSETDYLTDYKK
jgi:hypothetical protein